MLIMFLDVDTLEALSIERDPVRIDKTLNAKFWEWYAENRDDHVVTLWLAVKVHVRDLRPLWIKLFGQPATDSA